MAGPLFYDRVQESSTTTGTGTYTLAGATTGFQAWSVVGNTNTAYYMATDGTNWEVGLGTYTSSGTTLARTSILSSSNANAAVSWAAGTRTISLVDPAGLWTALLLSFLNLSVVAGDTIYGSGANTVARLPKGADGTVLTLASGLPSWTAGGGWTLLNSVTLSGTSQSFTGIASGYRQFVLEFEGILTNNTAPLTVALSVDNGSTYGTTRTCSGNLSTSNVCDGSIFINGVSETNLGGKTIQPYTVISGSLFSTAVIAPPPANGVVNALRVSSAATFTAGTARLYGVK